MQGRPRISFIALLQAAFAVGTAGADEDTCDGTIEIVTPVQNGFCIDEPTRPMYAYGKVAIRCSDGEIGVGSIPDDQFKLYSGGWEQPVNCASPPSPWEGQGAAANTCGANCDAKPALATAASLLQCLDADLAASLRAKVGDPVDLATGFVDYAATDVDLGRGLAFTRVYSSGLLNRHGQGVETAMGVNWRHGLAWRVRRISARSGAGTTTARSS